MSVTEAGDLLAMINASLNATSAVALVVGFVFIRRKVVDMHRRAMLTAVGASALFLVFYVTRVALTGTHEFAGEGLARIVYLGVLFTHMILAVVVVPFVLRLLYLAHRERFEEHKRLARLVFPVWAYVSVTGLVVYLLLYQIYGYV
jgi:putative membrane protein